APFSRRQIPQADTPDAHALESCNLESRELAHSSDLTLFALTQDETQLVRVLPFHVGALECGTVQRQSEIELRHAISTQRSFDPHQLFFLDLRLRADQSLRNASILGKDQQAGRIYVQAARRCDSTDVRRTEAQRRAVFPEV